MRNNFTGFESIVISEHRTAAETYEYELLRTESGARVSYYCGPWNFREDMDREDCLERRVEGGAELYERICSLAVSCRLVKWDGYHKAPKNVLDGGGFSFTAVMPDGRKLGGYGENAYPKGYREFMEAVRKILYGEDRAQ